MMFLLLSFFSYIM